MRTVCLFILFVELNFSFDEAKTEEGVLPSFGLIPWLTLLEVRGEGIGDGFLFVFWRKRGFGGEWGGNRGE